MTTAYHRLFSVWVSLGLSLGGSLFASAQGTDQAARDKAQILQRILEFETQGKALYDQGVQYKYDERVTAYWNASFFVARLIKDYECDASTLANLYQTFRFAYDLERADRIALAVQQYQECLRHSMITDPGAVWDEGKIPWSTLIEQRLAELRPQEPDAFAPRDQAEARSGQSVFFTSAGKGSIEKSMRTYHLLRGGGFRPLTTGEAVQVAARSALLLSGGTQAIAMLEKPMAQAGLQCQAVRTRDLVVFAVSFAPIPARTASDLADGIGSIRQAIVQKYFPARRVDSVPLVVYAGMGDERLGVALSQAIHFRSRDELEGYYEPLDHSLVLRKNCYFQGQPRPWILGTAAHELTHALIKPEFPDAPIWLDEGMASLQEESENGGPLDNYRLYFLTAALDSQRLPTVERLVDPANLDWFGAKAPLMYAMARYFCFYLESVSRPRNALIEVYRALREARISGRARTSALAVLEAATGKAASALDDDFRRFLTGRDLRSIERKWGSLRHDSEEYIRNLDRSGPVGIADLPFPPPPVARPAPPAPTPTIGEPSAVRQVAIRAQREPETAPPAPPVVPDVPPPAPNSASGFAAPAVQAPIAPAGRAEPTDPGASDAPPAPDSGLPAPAKQAPFSASTPQSASPPPAPTPGSFPVAAPLAAQLSLSAAVPSPQAPQPVAPPVPPPPVFQTQAVALGGSLFHHKPQAYTMSVVVPISPTAMVPTQAAAPQAYATPPPAQPVYAPPPPPMPVFVTASPPELSGKLSPKELQTFLIETGGELKQIRIELTKAQAEVESRLKALQEIVAGWRSQRASLETVLAAAETERLLGISEAEQPSGPEVKRDRLFQDYKSRIGRIQDDLEAAVLRVRTLKRMVHSIQGEIEDAEFLADHKRSLERVGNGAPAPDAPPPPPPVPQAPSRGDGRPRL